MAAGEGSMALVGTAGGGILHLVVATPTSSVTSSVLVKPLILTTNMNSIRSRSGNFMPGGVVQLVDG